jgi:hypothetical protein
MAYCGSHRHSMTKVHTPEIHTKSVKFVFPTKFCKIFRSTFSILPLKCRGTEKSQVFFVYSHNMEFPVRTCGTFLSWLLAIVYIIVW